MRLLALDFDGVLSDSAPECFVVALRAYVALRPDSPHRAFAELLGGHGAPALQRVETCPAYAPFLEMMPLGNRAEDYGVELAAVEAGRALPDQEAYDEFKGACDPAWLGDYHTRFYREREALRAADVGGWYGLMKPYTEFHALLRRRAHDAALAVVTSKDRRSVDALLRAYGIDDLFPGERILDKEIGVSKVAHLEVLAGHGGLPFKEITFVDDKVNHLDAVAPLGVRCGLASWGYNGEREVRLARNRGYLVCRLDDAEVQLYCTGGA